MIRSKFFSRFIVVTLTAALLLVSGSRAIRVSALAVGPIADPVYDTEIIAFKEYVEQNLDNPQLDIMFFLVGGLAVAQLGAQDAQLVSPYPVEHNVKEWLINCGIQLYNSVIGLVPEGDYYIGIPNLGGGGQVKGIPRETIKALVAQMMGDAVVAANYSDLDNFLEENPNEIFVPFNKNLQIGVNSIFGVLGGANHWQYTESEFRSNFSWNYTQLTGSFASEYNAQLANVPMPRYLVNSDNSQFKNIVFSCPDKFVFFINNVTHEISLLNEFGQSLGRQSYYFLCAIPDSSNLNYGYVNWDFRTFTYDPSLYNDYVSIVNAYISPDNYNSSLLYQRNYYAYPVLSDLISEYRVGSSYSNSELVTYTTDLNYDLDNLQYYEQVTNDYLLDIRGLMGDLVNYVYIHNPVFDNIYDLLGNLVVPDRVKVSVDLTPITQLLAPPVPVNLNDIAELTENTYLERVKEHARNAGDIFANYVAFWHNCDSDLVYTLFGAAILVLVGAFVGKWGHS